MSPLERPELRRLLEVRRLLVVDFEMTCGPGVTADVQDIIEIGTCVVWPASRQMAGAPESMLVKPQRSRVTEFCTRLTGITPERVGQAPGFERQAGKLKELAVREGVDAWAGWGPDHHILHRQCEALGVADPLDSVPYFDIRRLLSPVVNLAAGAEDSSSKVLALKTALERMGLGFAGRHHSADADAHNAARLLAAVADWAWPRLEASAPAQPARRHRL